MAKKIEKAPKGAAAKAVIGDAAELVRANREQTKGVIEAYLAAVKSGRSTFPKATKMTKSERQSSHGRVAAADLPLMKKTLDLVDAFPGVFGSLASKDHGKDPTKVETDPARHAIELLEALVPLVEELQGAAREASDLALRLGEIARDVTTPAYAIANANAPINDALRAAVAPINDGYRAKNQAKKAEKTARKKPAAPTG